MARKNLDSQARDGLCDSSGTHRVAWEIMSE